MLRSRPSLRGAVSVFGALFLAWGGSEVSALPRNVTVAGCDYYASADGSGDGRSTQSPFRIADFWDVASSGKTLCLMDGTFNGAQDMISPPAGLSGTEDSPITVKALDDGAVLLTGHGVRQPILLSENDWFVVEGVNACCSSGTVVAIDHSNHNVVRRVAAWDAAEGNNFIFGVYRAEHNLLEDVAGWGIARKVFSSSQGGNFTTIRRAWGRWEGSHVVGPKLVYTLAYNNYDMLIENSIGTWSGEKMQQTYVLLDDEGRPWLGNDGGTYTNYRVNQPYGIFGIDNLTGDQNARARLLGSIAYVQANDRFPAPQQVFVTGIDTVELNNLVAVYAPGGVDAGKHTFALYGLTNRVSDGGETNLRALNLTSIDGNSLGNQIGAGWQQANVIQSLDRTTLPTAASGYPGVQGASICYQYVDGELTERPLWPWPMNSRIREATASSGRAPVDVTSTIEAMLGAIPADCRRDTRADAVRTPNDRPNPRTVDSSARTTAVPTGPPHAEFGFPDNSPAGQEIPFTDRSANHPTTWSWNFGDGGTSTEQNPTHTFAAPGRYRVKLTASNASGSSLAEHWATVVAP